MAKALILADNHFLSAAVGRLKVQPGSFARSFSTDGFALGFDSARICADFKREKVAPKHDLMHTVMHCIFLHPYVAPNINEGLWSLACDIAVERNVSQICGRRPGSRGDKIQAAVAIVEKEFKGNITAEKIYHALCQGKWSAQVASWYELFVSDDHSPWYSWGEPTQGGSDSSEGEGSSSGSSSPGQGAEDSQDAQSGDRDALDCSGQSREAGNEDSEQSPSGDGDPKDGECPGQGAGRGSSRKVVVATRPGRGLREVGRANRDAQQEEWRRVAKALAINLQTYAKARGQSLNGLVGELEETAHQRVDYADFLRQFATPGEVLKVSEDEFDYIFYTYGLSLYGNLPLIEPLEYREEKRIREFVIVIDTSGSVYGEIVKRFIDATFDILKSTEAFFERVHVRIIQCDAAVQSDDVITSLEELKEWGRTMKIHGSGGTDFRPAFAYVDKLVEDGEFENLGGLIYFTDGWGTYPEWMPDYKVAFVFYDEDYRPEIVPTWAAQIVLDKEQLG